jgi:Ca-activated chloride channel family protein
MGQNQYASLKGKVLDSNTQEELPFANILIEKADDTTKYATTSDFEGNYSFKQVTPGKYTLTATYLGYVEQKVTNITLTANKTSYYDIKLHEGINLPPVEVVFHMSLIDRDNTSTGSRVVREDIHRMPARSIGKVSGTRKKHSRIRGSRAQAQTHLPQSQYGENETYELPAENRFYNVKRNPLSTFSSDVDMASYANIRRILRDGELPPVAAVRIEEMLNYFNYTYHAPSSPHPIAVHTEMGPCSWNEKNLLVKIGLQAEKIDFHNLPANHLTFLLDVSGSMSSSNKLPLLKKSLQLLVAQLRPEDQVSIVVYAGASGLVLPATSGRKKETIRQAIENLQAGGSTAGASGIELAYQIAESNKTKSGINRVILATDGDFNVGISNDNELIQLIESKRDNDIFLSVLGFGMGNLKDAKLEKLADHGNGNYAYIDDLLEAKKVLINELGATLHTIAKDVKIQVEFNPAKIKSYRLIGYENRMLSKEDFKDDKKDAGDMGAGHHVTALYEIVPASSDIANELLEDELKYQETHIKPSAKAGNEALTVKVRYKNPKENQSQLIVHEVIYSPLRLEDTSDDFRFASAVAQFGMLLRNSEYVTQTNFDATLALAQGARGLDENGYRSQFIELVKLRQQLN